MPVAKVVTAQSNFSGGEADIWIKRADQLPLQKAAGRQMRNWRVLNSGASTNRPGRSLIGIDGPRVDAVFMLPNQKFYLVFGTDGNGVGFLRVYNASFTTVFFNQSTATTWTTATSQYVVWDIYNLSIYITFKVPGTSGQQPVVLTWDGVSQTSTWTIAFYQELVESGGQKRTMFYRLSPQGVVLQPSAVTGNITLNFSAGMNLVAGHVGTRIRYANRQILITGVSNAMTATGTVEEQLYYSVVLGFGAGSNISQFFSIGDPVIGQTSGAQGIVTAISGGNTQLVIQHTSGTIFGGGPGLGEIIVGPNGSSTFTSVIAINQPPQPIVVWDDEVMNSFRGYPGACWIDQSRLGFCDFPALPQFMVWSAIGNLTDLYTDANNATPINCIQELAPRKSRVMYVLPGMEGSEFVFCDNAVYYIPINQTTPLQPGSIAFNGLTSDGCAQVQPRNVQQSIIFVGAGGTQVKVVNAIGAYYRPFIVDDITELHSHLLNNPVAIAVPGASTQFEERYLYLLNSDGSILQGKYALQNGVMESKNVGWLPWSGNGSARWISSVAGHPDVIITAIYNGQGMFELVDATQYLDAAVLYNSLPSGFTPPGGKGPLWFTSGSVDLMDGGRMMGTYQIDANGFLIPQNNAGEDFTSATLAAGQAWTATLEPFVPAVQPGQDMNQRLRKRRIQRFEIYVQNSSGFVYQRLFAGAIKPTYPTTFTATCSGTANTVIPVGAGVVDPSGNVFQTVQTGTIPAAGSINLNFAAAAAGPVPVPTAVTIQPPGISGWTGVAILQGGTQGQISPAYGDVMNIQRIPAWNQDDNPTLPPPLREQSYSWRPVGRNHDPRVAIVKDTPGPLTILEIDFEVSV